MNERTKEMREAGSIWQVSVRIRFWRCAAVMSWSCDHVHTCVCDSGLRCAGATERRSHKVSVLIWKTPLHLITDNYIKPSNQNKCQSISPIWLLKCRKISIKPRIKMSKDRGKYSLVLFKDRPLLIVPLFDRQITNRELNSNLHSISCNTEACVSINELNAELGHSTNTVTFPLKFH